MKGRRIYESKRSYRFREPTVSCRVNLTSENSLFSLQNTYVRNVLPSFRNNFLIKSSLFADIIIGYKPQNTLVQFNHSLREVSMAGRNDSLLDALTTLPWRMNVVLAILVFFPCKYILPVIPVSNPFLKGIAHQTLPTLAPVLALLLLMFAGLSALCARRKRRLLNDQEDM